MIRNALIAVYILAVLAISVGARAEVQNLKQIETTASAQDHFRTLIGEMVTLADGSFGLLDENQQFLSVKSQIDLTPYVGFKVMVSGIGLEQQLAPGLAETVDPLPSFYTGSKMTIFFVFGINEVR